MSVTAQELTLKVSMDLPYDQAIQAVTAALKEEGFGVLTDIDVKATLKKKLDADFRKYVILGACNPTLAHQALNTDLEIGTLLPCNVVVYEHNGGSEVLIVDPISMLGVVDNPALDEVATEAKERLTRVKQALERL